MANFMAIRDADTKRRFDFIRRIKPEIAPVEGLSERVCSLEDFSLIWAAGDWAPISSAVDEEGIVVITT